MAEKRPFESFLTRFDEPTWLQFVDSITPKIHEVDRKATTIWFRFYPLSLKKFIDSSENKAETVAKMQIQGSFELKD
jgi:hypothetical protein